MVSPTIPKGYFKGTSQRMRNECNTVDIDFPHKAGDPLNSRCLHSILCSCVLFSVVKNVIGKFGEHPEGFLNGKHYILLNHVFIPD